VNRGNRFLQNVGMYLPTYLPTRIHGITLENRYGEEMGYGTQDIDLGKGVPTEGM